MITYAPMALAAAVSDFCAPRAAAYVEQAKQYAKSQNIKALGGGCSCTASRTDVPASRSKCYVPCDPETQRQRVEETLHSLQLYPPSKRLSMAAYIMARNIASEGGSGTGAEKLALGEVLVHRAQASGKTFAQIALYDGRYFGQQYGRNPAVATKANPKWDDLVAAELVLAGESGNLTRGATHYFGPNAFGATTKTAREALDLWYSRDSLNWVGYVPGIDIRRQMFFREAPRDPAILAKARVAMESHSPSWVMRPAECAPGVAASVALPVAMGAVAVGALGFMLWARKRALS